MRWSPGTYISMKRGVFISLYAVIHEDDLIEKAEVSMLALIPINSHRSRYGEARWPWTQTRCRVALTTTWHEHLEFNYGGPIEDVKMIVKIVGNHPKLIEDY